MMSGKKAWVRQCAKHSPSKNTFISPIKPILYNVTSHNFSKDPYNSLQIWALLNTEEFFYQNTCSLVYHEFLNEFKFLKLLRDTRVQFNWAERLVGLIAIGKGSFGDVYRAQDKSSNIYYAMKRILKRKDIDNGAESFITNILREKNTLAELNKSPFFVRMVGAFQEPDGIAYWFVMEYCLCDLKMVASKFDWSDSSDYLIESFLKGTLFTKINESLSEKYHTPYADLAFIYIFELLCALHYLATKHVVHADLKLENVLISTTGHVKMADFGLAFRDNWFYRNSIILLVTKPIDVAYVYKFDEENLPKGNALHQDPEIRIGVKIRDEPEMLDKIRNIYSVCPYIHNLNSFNQVFLSDLYAVGFLSVQLLFGKLNLKKRPEKYRLRRLFIWAIDLAYDEELGEEYVYGNLLENVKGTRFESVMKFLISLLKPREIRAQGFLSTMKIFENHKVKQEKYIDISKVEEIPYYKDMQLNKLSVLNLRFRNEYITALMENFVQSEDDKILLVRDNSDGPRSIYPIPGFEFADTEYFK